MGCYVWYSSRGGACAVGRLRPLPVLSSHQAAHQSTASVTTSYYSTCVPGFRVQSTWHYNYLCTLKPGTHWQRSRQYRQQSERRPIGNNVEASWILMNTVESKLIYLLHNFVASKLSNTQHRARIGIDWTDSRTLKFTDLLLDHHVTHKYWSCCRTNRQQSWTFNKVDRVADLLPIQQSRPCWIQRCCQCVPGLNDASVHDTHSKRLNLTHTGRKFECR